MLFDLLIDGHVIFHGEVISFLKETSHVLQFDGQVRAKAGHLVVVHVLVAHHLVDQDVLWLAISLVDDARVGGVSNVVLEQRVGDTFVLLKDLVLDDVLGGIVGVKELDLGLRAWDVVRLVVLVLLEALFYALDWLVNLTNIAG